MNRSQETPNPPNIQHQEIFMVVAGPLQSSQGSSVGNTIGHTTPKTLIVMTDTSSFGWGGFELEGIVGNPESFEGLSNAVSRSPPPSSH